MFCLDRVQPLGLGAGPATAFPDMHRAVVGLAPRPAAWAGSRSSPPLGEPHAHPRCRQARVRVVSARAGSQRGDSFGDGKKHARRALLLNYVQDVQPQVMEQFAEQSPPQVVGAMRQTITNLLGTLPPQFFTVRVHTVGENLAQLMYSVMMTGYMFRNTQYRMELKNTLGTLPPTPTAPEGAPAHTPVPITPEVATLILQPTAARTSTSSAPPPADRLLSSTSSMSSTASVDIDLHRDGTISTTPAPPPTSPSTSTSSTSSLDDTEYAPGVQKTRVQGEVLRWHYVKGVEEMSAVEYMELLEAEVASLRHQVATLAAAPPRAPAGGQQQQQQQGAGGGEEGRNELLEYLKSLEQHSLQELTSGAGEEVAEAMNTFIHRLLGTQDQGQLRDLASDCTAPELAKLLFWLMVVGYSLRSLEVRFDMERSLEHGSGGKELPPGR